MKYIGSPNNSHTFPRVNWARLRLYCAQHTLIRRPGKGLAKALCVSLTCKVNNGKTLVQRYKEIILHAGLGKTGTTSMQNNCFHQRDLLAEHGIVYPSFWLRGRRLVNHSDIITGALCEETASYGFGYRNGVTSEEEASELREELRKQLLPVLEEPTGDILVLSGEMVAQYRPDDLRLVEEALAAHAERLRVVIYLRSPQSALESMLQQQVQGALPRQPEDILGIVRNRFEHLRDYFQDRLEVINFHEAIEHDAGLVGSFLELIGLPPEVVNGLTLTRNNERVSEEAFELMVGINERLPRLPLGEPGFKRRHHDMVSLLSLPGQPFQLRGYVESEIYDAALEEAAWLEQELGFSFPDLVEVESAPRWQKESLFALEDSIRGMSKRLQLAAADYLTEAAQADALPAETAAVLQFVAERLVAVETNPIPGNVKALGADYFKFSALQVERASPEMALTLMRIAQALNPTGAQIIQRVAAYEEQLEKQKGE